MRSAITAKSEVSDSWHSICSTASMCDWLTGQPTTDTLLCFTSMQPRILCCLPLKLDLFICHTGRQIIFSDQRLHLFTITWLATLSRRIFIYIRDWQAHIHFSVSSWRRVVTVKSCLPCHPTCYHVT